MLGDFEQKSDTYYLYCKKITPDVESRLCCVGMRMWKLLQKSRREEALVSGMRIIAVEVTKINAQILGIN